MPDQINGVALRVIAPAELSAANIWVTNWQRMLPVINATRALLSKSPKSLLAFVREPVALANGMKEALFTASSRSETASAPRTT